MSSDPYRQQQEDDAALEALERRLRIAAADAQGVLGVSGEPLSAPSALVTKVGGLAIERSPGFLRLSWSPVPNTRFYRVEFADNPDFRFLDEKRVANPTYLYVDRGTEVFFRVTAIDNDLGPGPVSDTISGQTGLLGTDAIEFGTATAVTQFRQDSFPNETDVFSSEPIGANAITFEPIYGPLLMDVRDAGSVVEVRASMGLRLASFLPGIDVPYERTMYSIRAELLQDGEVLQTARFPIVSTIGDLVGFDPRNTPAGLAAMNGLGGFILPHPGEGLHEYQVRMKMEIRFPTGGGNPSASGVLSRLQINGVEYRR